MHKNRNAVTPEKRDVFTSRAPRNPEEIDTCVAMLEDSPFWDSAHYPLSRPDIVQAWVDLLFTGRGYIDIVENEAYGTRLGAHRNPNGTPRYDHAFCMVAFVCYVRFEFAREIITRTDIPDIHMHFLQSMIAHRADAAQPCPAMTAEQMLLGQRQAPGHGLYCFASLVGHPAFDSGAILSSSPQLMDRLRRSPHQICGGLMHHAWITNAAPEFSKHGFTQFGNKLLREYPGNEMRPSEKKKYIFCLTKDQKTSEALGIPAEVEANIDHERCLGNWYKIFFDDRKPCAGLNKNEQHTCFLIMLGYTPAQIAQALSCPVGSVVQYQNQAGEKLYEAGYHGAASNFRKDGASPKHSRETISKIIFDNLHEVRSYLLPLYPWPDDVFLR